MSAVFEGGVLGSPVFSERTTEEIKFEVCGAAGRLRVSCNRVDGLALHPAGADPASPRAGLRRIPEVLRLLPPALWNLRQGGDFKTSYRTQPEHVLDAIRTNGPVGCTPEEGRPALQTALAAVESAATGRPVRVHVAARRSA